MSCSLPITHLEAGYNTCPGDVMVFLMAFPMSSGVGVELARRGHHPLWGPDTSLGKLLQGVPKVWSGLEKSL